MVHKYKLFDLNFSTYVKFHFPLCKYVGNCLQGHLKWKIGNVALKYCTHWSWCLFRALDNHSCLCKDRTADLAVQGTQRGQNFCFTQRQSTAKRHLHVNQLFLGVVDAWCCSHWVAHWISLLHWENCLEESVFLLPQGRRSSWGREWWLLWEDICPQCHGPVRSSSQPGFPCCGQPNRFVVGSFFAATHVLPVPTSGWCFRQVDFAFGWAIQLIISWGRVVPALGSKNGLGRMAGHFLTTLQDLTFPKYLSKNLKNKSQNRNISNSWRCLQLC